MMSSVAEVNDSHGRRAPRDGEPQDPRKPEVVDAEIVESGPPAGPSRDTRHTAGGPQDDEAFRQYQQFLEFQKFKEFQEWQRSQGGTGTTGTSPAAAGRPRWKRVLRTLRFKPVRRLLYLLVLAGIAYAWLGQQFGGGGGDQPQAGGGVPGNQDRGLSPVLPGAPDQAVIGVYNYIAYSPEQACLLFDAAGKAAFAASHAAPDCTAAARRLHAQVTAPKAYAVPGFGENAVVIAGPDAAVHSCRMRVEGGPRLGAFSLRLSGGGWLIDGHEKEPAGCTTG